MDSTQNTSDFIPLVIANLIPLHVVLAALTWILHDYIVTLEDEVRTLPQRRSFSKFMFFWIRYYSIALLLFDAVQIHVFALPGVPSNNLCVAMDTVIRVVGAISLWSVEIVMQLRIYALYDRSKRIAALNLALFICSIGAFIAILVFNHSKRASVIAGDIHLPLPGCPAVHSGLEWAQWVPATIFELILFALALFKTCDSTLRSLRKDAKLPLHTLLLRDSVLYFFGIACVLIFNNVRTTLTHIPWFSYGPFHAAVGIMTTRMLINLRKATSPHTSHGFDSFDPGTTFVAEGEAHDDHTHVHLEP
ncbi:hypothetical protein DFH06DRAFT_971612 [Mycena polygramma]|nr:hypothetical protein DFH06DRAFT_971612 [Mycena polygramma]